MCFVFVFVFVLEIQNTNQPEQDAKQVSRLMYLYNVFVNTQISQSWIGCKTGEMVDWVDLVTVNGI